MDNIQTEQDQSNPTTGPIHFRAGKKRKAYRQRAAEEGDDDDAMAIPAASVLPGVSSLKDVEPGRDADDGGAEAQDPRGGSLEKEDDDSGDDDEGDDETTGGSAVAAALRLRNARRAGRRGGVGFRSEGRSEGQSAGQSAGGNDEDYSEHALIVREQDRGAAPAAHDRIVGGITNRFMHQTGLLTILDDKHMNAYIESRLASRDADSPQGTSSRPQPPPSSSTFASPHVPNHIGATASGQPDKWRDQPTRHGKLVEVDMTEVHDRANSSQNNNNNNNSNNNKRRLVGRGAAEPPPRRGRNRRNSGDIARDALVEQFLHENRLDVYDVPSSSSLPAASSASSAPGADPSADDRVAEQFRQQYYHEQAMRRKKRRPAQQQQQQKQQSENVLKGPKLGGSRNMRAAVRDILLQKEKDKKGK
ncbi:hypothetical protein V8C37DRAFT_383243 [Trichoderma ceciliae]